MQTTTRVPFSRESQHTRNWEEAILSIPGHTPLISEISVTLIGHVDSLSRHAKDYGYVSA